MTGHAESLCEGRLSGGEWQVSSMQMRSPRVSPQRNSSWCAPVHAQDPGQCTLELAPESPKEV